MVDLVLRRDKEFDEIVGLVRLTIPSADIIHNGDEITIRTTAPTTPAQEIAIKQALKNSSIVRGEFK